MDNLLPLFFCASGVVDEAIFGLAYSAAGEADSAGWNGQTHSGRWCAYSAVMLGFYAHVLGVLNVLQNVLLLF